MQAHACDTRPACGLLVHWCCEGPASLPVRSAPQG
jgi:hypothetical protein